MPIKIFCPRCQTGYNLADTMRGKVIQCKNCQRKIQVDGSDDAPAAETRVQTDRPVSRVPPASQPRRAEVQEDDRPRRLRPEEDEDDRLPRAKVEEVERPRRRRRVDEEDDRPRRSGRRSRSEANANMAILISVAAVLVVVGLVMGIWLAVGRKSTPVVPVAAAPAPPPPAEQAPPNPGNNNPQNIHNPNIPNNNPATNPAPPANVDPNVTIVLSNPRHESNPFSAFPNLVVDYRFQVGGPKAGGQYFLIINPSQGIRASEVALHSFDLQTSGTIRVNGISLGPTRFGAMQLFMEFGSVGPFGNRLIVSNTVTFSGNAAGGMPPNQPPGGAPVPPAQAPPPQKLQALDDAGITRALADLKADNQINWYKALGELAATPPLANRRTEVANVLLEVIGGEDVSAALTAAKAMKTWATKDQVSGLIKCLTSPWGLVRQGVLEVLVPMKDERAIEPLAQRLSDLSDRRLAADGLRAIGPPAEKAVLKMLSSTDHFTRKEACQILGDIGGQESIGPLTELASDRRQLLLSRDAAQALGKIKSRAGAAQK